MITISGQSSTKVSSVFIYISNIKYLAIEMFCVNINLSSPIMNDIFKRKDGSRCDLNYFSEFSRPLMKSVYHGSEIISFRGPKIWDMLPDDCKDIDNLNTFENKVKKWKPENCPCILCKVYINNIGVRKSLKHSDSTFRSIAVASQYWFVTNKITYLLFTFLTFH